MNMSKSRDIQAKMPSPKVIYASNESKSVLARNLEECRDNDKNSQSVFLSFKCILARNCEGTEQCCWAQSKQLLSINKTEKTLDFFSVLFYISISNNYCYYLWKGGSLWPL